MIILGLFGVGGLVYAVIVLRRMLRQAVYQPVLEDWIFHLILPFLSYVLLAVTPIWGEAHAKMGLFGVAAASLLLLFTGIHNAWDAVVFQVLVSPEKGGTHEKDQRSHRKGR